MKKDFTKLDEMILAHIQGGRRFAHALETIELRQLCRTINPDAAVFRMIDGRLQAMRRAGKIAYDHKTGWAVQ